MVNNGKKFYIFDKNFELKSLNESYECKVDAKFRLPLPTGLRKQWADILDDGFVLKRSVFQPCIEIHPMQKWEEIEAKLAKLNQFVKKNQDFVRIYKMGIKSVEVDANGRIQLPKELVDFVGLPKEIVLAPSIGMLEIWDKTQYESVVQIDEFDFAALTEEVMGGIKDDETNVS